ncbi:unnamed protein product [Cuscuta epithymum]|uniref:Transcription repressor n=1 Tax=Cuscuta epithymum TaxID=186058 RepID=A0AAV0FHQ8_9ASTE|nr:unnamed protein product [Cuscuta epithymum]
MKFVPAFFSKSSEATRPPWSPKTTSSGEPNAAAVGDQYLSSSEDECVENVIKGVKSSERLFFQPGQAISFKPRKEDDEVEAAVKEEEECPIKESVALSMESMDPLLDFKRSMEEMVAAHHHDLGWEFLEELLTCYLKMNEKRNHGFIVGAFVDLLVSLSMASSSSSGDGNGFSQSCTATHSFTSPLSFCSSSCSVTSPTLSSSAAAQEAQDEVQSSAGTV